MKKAIHFFTVILAILLCISSCSQPHDSDATESNCTDDTESASDIQKEIPEYYIVYSFDTDSTVSDAINDMSEKIEELLGEPFPIRSDQYKGLDGNIEYTEYEIIIGETNRDESVFLDQEIKYRDYGYVIKGTKILIIGYTADTLIAAVEKFTHDLENSASPLYFLSSDSTVIVSESDTVQSLSINGNELRSYTVIYPQSNENGESIMAEELAITLSEMSGYKIYARADNEMPYSNDSCEILIGATNRNIPLPSDIKEDDVFIGVNGSTLSLNGVNVGGIYHSCQKFLKLLNENISADNINVSLENSLHEASNIESLRIMSFNIQVGYRSSTRDEQVIEMIKKYDADVIGLQEASLDWIQTILKACPEYTYVGKSRDGSLSGEYNPILYKEDKFTLIDSTTKWLSPTPDVVSRFPESNMNRITTIAILRRNSDGRTFVHANTHLHHDNDTARTLQAEVLIKLLGDYSDYPIFISGDFNASYSALCISRIKDAEYESSEYLAYKCQSYITTNNKWGGGGGGVIDYIFSHPNKSTILSYRVCTEMINGSYASDHNPLYIEAIIP